MDTDFSAIKKLLDFGIDSSFANSMVKSMNGLVSNMSTPGSMSSFESKTPATGQGVYWFKYVNGMVEGPFDKKEILDRLFKRVINKNTFVWTTGFSEWKRVEEVPEVLELIFQLPPSL